MEKLGNSPIFPTFSRRFGVVFPTLQAAQSTHEAVDVTEHDKMARQPGGNRAVEKLFRCCFSRTL